MHGTFSRNSFRYAVDFAASLSDAAVLTGSFAVPVHYDSCCNILVLVCVAVGLVANSQEQFCRSVSPEELSRPPGRMHREPVPSPVL